MFHVSFLILKDIVLILFEVLVLLFDTVSQLLDCRKRSVGVSEVFSFKQFGGN